MFIGLDLYAKSFIVLCFSGMELCTGHYGLSFLGEDGHLLWKMVKLFKDEGSGTVLL